MNSGAQFSGDTSGQLQEAANAKPDAAPGVQSPVEQERHVRWTGKPEHVHHLSSNHAWDAAEEAHYLALGMGRRGSFHPTYGLAFRAHHIPGRSEQDGHLRKRRHQPRAGTGEHGCHISLSIAEDSEDGHGHADGARVAATGNKTLPSVEGKALTAANSVGYQPYSLNDYWEHNLDPKHQSYWMLGKLGPTLDEAKVQVRHICSLKAPRQSLLSFACSQSACCQKL
jgi:hypothetical protein